MENKNSKLIELVRNGYSIEPDFDFDYIEKNISQGETFEDTNNRLHKEFKEIMKENK